ncbi:MAG: hypothetical protein R2800_09400 [Flavipsychrobacter sp.]
MSSQKNDEEKEDSFENLENKRKLEMVSELIENVELIEKYKLYAANLGIALNDSNFEFIPTTGIVVNYPGIVPLLHPELTIDQDGLMDYSILQSKFKRHFFAKGYLYSDTHILMAHPYFRRSYHPWNNFSPRFIEYFWSITDPNIQAHIALDYDRVRINLDTNGYMELDTWYGPKFNKDIREIPDSISKIAPPLDLLERYIELIFGGVHSLDIKWSSRQGIKTFQAEEFRQEQTMIVRNGLEYYPSKYLHAEFDIQTGMCNHLDGAIHFYNKDEYLARRDSDFNYNIKNSGHIKGDSLKLFKLNGEYTVEIWMEFVGQFLTGNPLVFEYFDGQYPDYVLERIERVRSIR